jgi:hypothetical protein
VTEPLLPDVTSDESGIGWGDDAAVDEADAERADEDRLNAERPPHHDRP